MLNDQLRAATKLLERVAGDRALLAQLTIEERTRLLTAAGDIYCPDLKERRAGVDKAKEFRLHFLRGLKPEHPLHDTPEARVARGEAVEWQIANGR